MTDAQVDIEKLTLEDFVRRYNEEGPFEFVNGEIIALSPTVLGPNVVTKRLFAALLKLEEAGMGEVFTEMPFVLTDQSDWVKGSRVPDVMFIRANRMAEYRARVTDTEGKPLVIVPDLVVEVVSPTDRYSEVNQKVDTYLADGVPLIWVIDRQRRVVTVRRGSEYMTLSEKDILSGGDAVPGFEITVASLFE